MTVVENFPRSPVTVSRKGNATEREVRHWASQSVAVYAMETRGKSRNSLPMHIPRTEYPQTSQSQDEVTGKREGGEPKATTLDQNDIHLIVEVQAPFDQQTVRPLLRIRDVGN